MANTLQAQLLARVATFRRNFPTISKAEIARHCQIDEANFSAALNGRRGLSADGVLRLHTLLNLSRREVLAKFSTPVRNSKILCLQESVEGRPARMRLDGNDSGAWVPGLSGTDPNDSTGIDNTPSADTTGPVWDQDLIDNLRETRGYHRKAIRAINDFINRAKANRDGTTPPTAQKFGRRS
jgi:hypothetical protein